jgi:hypothetical protein
LSIRKGIVRKMHGSIKEEEESWGIRTNTKIEDI